MLFPNCLVQHELQMLARVSLRDVALGRNKYLIVTSDAFLLQNNRTLCTAIVMEKDTKAMR